MGRKQNLSNGEASKLRSASLRFSKWRKMREGKSRIPNRLWELATDLGLEFGISRTAGVLGLGYDDLKKRVSGRRATIAEVEEVSFFELPSLSGSVLPECSIELENDRGVRLKLELRGGAVPDVLEVARIFSGQKH